MSTLAEVVGLLSIKLLVSHAFKTIIYHQLPQSPVLTSNHTTNTSIKPSNQFFTTPQKHSSPTKNTDLKPNLANMQFFLTAAIVSLAGLCAATASPNSNAVCGMGGIYLDTRLRLWEIHCKSSVYGSDISNSTPTKQDTMKACLNFHSGKAGTKAVQWNSDSKDCWPIDHRPAQWVEVDGKGVPQDANVAIKL